MQYFTVLVYYVGGGSYGTDDINVRIGRAANRAQFPPIASVTVRVSLHSVTMWQGLVNALTITIHTVVNILTTDYRQSSRTNDVSNKIIVSINFISG